MKVIDKDPSAELDYKMLWADWLVTDTISVSSWVVNKDTITIDGDLTGATDATVFLSGGIAVTRYMVTNEITTVAGLKDQRSIIINCTDR